MQFQKTIKNAVHMNGIGLHSGKPVHLTVRPAPENTGIVFRRLDLNQSLKASPEWVIEAPMCTKLISGAVSFSTVEHIMSALAGLEIDNLIVELNSEEMPIMDGSASPFIFLLESAGIVKQEARRHVIRVKKTVRVEEGDKFAEISPVESGLHFMLSLDYQDPVISKTPLEIEFSMQPISYIKNVSRARTYGFVKDLEKLHANQLGLGASLENAVGVTDTGIANPQGLRYPDEFARHKLLDAIGDLYLAGSIQGHFRAHKPGHALNNKLLRALLADPEAWSLGD